MYLRVLWPYIVELIIFFILDYRVSGYSTISISPLGIAFFVMFLPFILSLFFFIRNYRGCKKSQKIVFILINIFALLSIVFCLSVYYNFIIHPFPIM